MLKRSPLAAFLEDRGLTQTEFSAMSGVPQSQISLYVNDDPDKRRRPGLRNALKIAKATKNKVPASSWNGGDDPAPAGRRPRRLDRSVA